MFELRIKSIGLELGLRTGRFMSSQMDINFSGKSLRKMLELGHVRCFPSRWNHEFLLKRTKSCDVGVENVLIIATNQN